MCNARHYVDATYIKNLLHIPYIVYWLYVEKLVYLWKNIYFIASIILFHRSNDDS